MTEAKRDLGTAVQLAARIVARYGDQYLPIFERLENELSALQTKTERLRRALEIAGTTRD